MNAFSTTDETLISFPEVCRRMGMGRSGINKIRSKDDTFPEAIRFGESRQARAYFPRAELEAWLDKRIAQRAKKGQQAKRGVA